MIKKRAERVRNYREALKPGAQHEERPPKSEMLKREIAALDAKIEAEHAARAAEAENTLEKKRELAARDLRQALAEEHRAKLSEQAGEAREHAAALERPAVKVDHALQGAGTRASGAMYENSPP